MLAAPAILPSPQPLIRPTPAYCAVDEMLTNGAVSDISRQNVLGPVQVLARSVDSTA